MHTTPLEAQPTETVAGRPLQTSEVTINNYRLSNYIRSLTTVQMFCVQCDSNNTLTSITPSDALEINQGLAVSKEDLDYAMQLNPTGRTSSPEVTYTLHVVEEDESVSLTNRKLQRVVTEIMHHIKNVLGLDSVQHANYVNEYDAKQLKSWHQQAITYIQGIIGDGQSSGLFFPTMAHLGRTVPDLDNNSVVTTEANPEAPVNGYPDVVYTRK